MLWQFIERLDGFSPHKLKLFYSKKQQLQQLVFPIVFLLSILYAQMFLIYKIVQTYIETHINRSLVNAAVQMVRQIIKL